MIVLFSCEDKKPSNDIICTEIFVSITITFKDKDANNIDVNEFTVKKMRTQKVISSGKDNSNLPEGIYIVADDMDKKEFTKSGDIVLVSAKHPATGIVKSAEFKIAADECHINKISGPTIIIFD